MANLFGCLAILWMAVTFGVMPFLPTTRRGDHLVLALLSVGPLLGVAAALLS